MIAIIDYDMGNLRSLENALDRLGATYCVTADPDTIRKADKVILPGVGHAGLAMDNLVERGLPAVIRSSGRLAFYRLFGLRLRGQRKLFGDLPEHRLRLGQRVKDKRRCQYCRQQK